MYATLGPGVLSMTFERFFSIICRFLGAALALCGILHQFMYEPGAGGQNWVGNITGSVQTWPVGGRDLIKSLTCAPCLLCDIRGGHVTWAGRGGGVIAICVTLSLPMKKRVQANFKSIVHLPVIHLHSKAHVATIRFKTQFI